MSEGLGVDVPLFQGIGAVCLLYDRLDFILIRGPGDHKGRVIVRAGPRVGNLLLAKGIPSNQGDGSTVGLGGYYMSAALMYGSANTH